MKTSVSLCILISYLLFLFYTDVKVMDHHCVDGKSRAHKREILKLISHPVEFVDTFFPVYKAKNVGA